jgi:hypothetical protein
MNLKNGQFSLFQIRICHAVVFRVRLGQSTTCKKCILANHFFNNLSVSKYKHSFFDFLMQV